MTGISNSRWRAAVACADVRRKGKGVAASRQSAANFVVSGKACGALPRRRYRSQWSRTSIFDN